MVHLNQNIHLLLPSDDLARLKRYAQAQRKSVGELIRMAIRKVYGETEPDQKAAAFKRLSQHDELEMADWDLVKADLLRHYE